MNVFTNCILYPVSCICVSCVWGSSFVQDINFPILLFYGFSIAIWFSAQCVIHVWNLLPIPSACAIPLSGAVATLGSPSSGGELFPRTLVLLV